MQIKTEKSPDLDDFSLKGAVRLTVEVLVVLVTADLPVKGLHGLFTVRKILLGDEGCLVGSDLGEVGFTLLHHRCYGGETETCCSFICRDRSCALVRVLLSDVQTLAVPFYP